METTQVLALLGTMGGVIAALAGAMAYMYRTSLDRLTKRIDTLELQRDTVLDKVNVNVQTSVAALQALSDVVKEVRLMSELALRLSPGAPVGQGPQAQP